MSYIELLVVEDRFLIKGRGLVLIPDFPVPESWRNREETVVVTKPDGEQCEAVAQFYFTHFNVADRHASTDERWRIVAILMDKTKEDLPIGSTISVSHELRNALLPGNVA